MMKKGEAPAVKGRTAYQQGEEIYILCSQIREAPYNPRVMGEGQEKRLRQAIQAHGLIGTLFWNRRTGNLVAGHQRLKQLDVLEGYPARTADDEIRVTAVDVPEREEKQLNVLLNNPSVQGEFDIDLLGRMMEDDGLNPGELGFTDADAAAGTAGDAAHPVGAGGRRPGPAGERAGRGKTGDCGGPEHGRYGWRKMFGANTVNQGELYEPEKSVRYVQWPVRFLV